jgi:hypothetical protein
VNGAEPYPDSRAHLAAELAWLDLALHALVPDGDLAGAAAAEVDPTPLRQARQDIADRLAASRDRGRALVLPRLRALFGLTAEEELLLVACAATELDPRYGKLYGQLHDDAARRQPSIPLVVALAGLDQRCRAGSGALLDPYAAVYRWRLVEVADGPGRSAALDTGMLALLSGYAAVDGRLDAALRPLPETDPAAWPYAGTVDRLAALLGDGRGHAVAHFHGPLAAEGRRVAVAACHRLGTGLLHADAAELLALAQSGAVPLADGLRLLYRQAALASAAVYLSGMDALLDDTRSAAHLRTLERLVAEASWFTCTEGERLWLPGAGFPRHVTYLPVEPSALDHAQRRTAWRRALPGLAAGQVEDLATRFALAPGQIADAVRLARARTAATAGGAGGAEPGFEELLWACRAPSQAGLDGLARRVRPRAGWADLVLPPDVLAQLRELCAQVRHRGRVLSDWALGRRASLGHGVQALFLGPSGTGKTLAAEVVAGEVGMDLLKVDLSAMVSKYIGETEKHLDRVFAAAERSGSVLFFDEADALFGKRSEVGDAHDRYANIEVSYLLQRIEEFGGTVVLATNFAQNIDDAFQRRLRVAVTFPFPDEAARLAIWRGHLPAELPVTDDLDLARMARQFKVSGGVIRKILWNAAFLAADDGGRLGTEHLLLATRREYERMGKPFLAKEMAR